MGKEAGKYHIGGLENNLPSIIQVHPKKWISGTNQIWN